MAALLLAKLPTSCQKDFFSQEGGKEVFSMFSETILNDSESFAVLKAELNT